MAQLYRRIYWLSYRVGLTWALLAGTSPAAAQSPANDELAPSSAELASLARDLGDEDESKRAAALGALAALDPESLPAVHDRVRSFRRRPLHSDTAYRALGAFRHTVGSLRADDIEVDMAPGVPLVLREQRDRVTIAMAERLLLLRALEAMGTVEAGRVMVDLMATDFEAWRWESRRLVQRMGARIVPTLIESLGHSEPKARQWARAGLRTLGIDGAGTAVQQPDITVLADTLRGYGTIRSMDAMPVVVSFTTHDRLKVRQAARWATEQYGRNAIWQLRRAYRNLTGSDANRAWGWRRLAEALYAAYDDQRLGTARTELTEGLSALGAGDLGTMAERFEHALKLAPALPERSQMAAGYAAMGARRLAEDDLAGAERLFQRAVRLGPNLPDAAAWRAQIAFVRAERRLSGGIVDLPGYRRALELDPDHAAASRAIDTLTGRTAQRASEHRRWAAGLAAALLAFVVFLFLRRRRRARQDTLSPPEEDELLSGLDAPDTLPGVT